MQHNPNNTITQPIEVLRAQWAQLWRLEPHRYIRRDILEKAIAFKQSELRGEGLNSQQQKRLEQLIKDYKLSPSSFLKKDHSVQEGATLVKVWRGRQYIVSVKSKGFEYEGQDYKSLSQIARAITGTNWNGWLFFGLKKRGGNHAN